MIIAIEKGSITLTKICPSAVKRKTADFHRGINVNGCKRRNKGMRKREDDKNKKNNTNR